MLVAESDEVVHVPVQRRAMLEEKKPTTRVNGAERGVGKRGRGWSLWFKKIVLSEQKV
jgi:hypothetical protein